MSSGEIFEIEIKGPGPFGFRMKGGIEFSLPFTVDFVKPGGKAAASGLKQGDFLLSINQLNLACCSHENAKKEVTASASGLKLVVRRGGGSATASSAASNKPKTDAVAAAPPTVVKSEPKKGQQSASSAAAAASTSVGKQQPTSSTAKPKAEPPKTQKTPISSGQTKAASPSGSASGNYTPGKINVQSEDTNCNATANFREAEVPPAMYHPAKIETDSGRCAACAEKLGSTFAKLGDRKWHQECFVCTQCKKSLAAVGFYENQNKIMCKDCYADVSAPKCAKCGRPCVERYVSAVGKSYHVDCFKCAKCQAALQGQAFNLHEDEPHCIECFGNACGLMCSGCNSTIKPGQEYVEAGENKFHDSCFCCAVCSVSLAQKGRYHCKEGRYLCSEHVGL